MSFNILSISDVVTIPAMMPADDFREEFFFRMERYLREKAYVHNIIRQGNILKYKAPPFRFVWNGWNLFNPVSHGSFYVVKAGNNIVISYKIWSLEYFVYSLLFSTVALYGFFPGKFFRLLYFVVVWMLYVFHLFWSRSRLEKLIVTISEQIVEDYKDSNAPSNEMVKY